MRKQIENRREFTYPEKQQIYEKSDYRCCWCGKKIEIHGKDSTIEHFIPISKGGTNDLKNLVCLCYDCNQAKNDMIVPPYDYYHYLLPGYREEIMGLYDLYCNDISYYDRNNFTKDDAREFIYYNRMQSLESRVPQCKKKNGHYGINIPMRAVLKKANYSDLDGIYEYCIRYHKKHNIDTGELKSLISSIFNDGAIYCIKKGNEIISVIPVSTSIICMDDDTENYAISINGLPTLYEKDIYKPLIVDCIKYILGEISKIDGEGHVVSKITVPTENEFLRSVVYMLTPSSVVEHGEWSTYILLMAFAPGIINYEGDDDIGIYKQLRDDQIVDGPKAIQKFSKSLQRAFNLKPLNEKKRKDKAKEDFKKATTKAVKKKKSVQKKYMRDYEAEEFYNYG